MWLETTNKFLYRPGKTYEYEFESDITTTVRETSSEKSSLHMRAMIQLQTVSECEMVLRVCMFHKSLYVFILFAIIIIIIIIIMPGQSLWCCHHDRSIARVHPSSRDECSTAPGGHWPPTFEPSRSAWTISPPLGHKLTHHRNFIITQPESWYSFTIPRKVEGWVDLVRWLHTEMVYPLAHGHTSKYYPGPA